MVIKKEIVRYVWERFGSSVRALGSFGHVMKLYVFVCYTFDYSENLYLGLAFLDNILHSECRNETDLFI